MAERIGLKDPETSLFRSRTQCLSAKKLKALGRD